MTDAKTKNVVGGQITEVVNAGKDYQVKAYDGKVRHGASHGDVHGERRGS